MTLCATGGGKEGGWVSWFEQLEAHSNPDHQDRTLLPDPHLTFEGHFLGVVRIAATILSFPLLPLNA